MVESKFFQIIKNRAILEKISFVIFGWLSLLFILNLQYDLTNDYDEIIFFISSLIFLFIIIYQIFFSKVNSHIILFEIFIIYLFFHLIYHAGFSGLRDSDAYIDYNLLQEILANGHFILGQDIFGVKGWPILHIFSAVNSVLTNIHSLFIAKYLPSFLSSIIVIPIYLLVYELYKNKKIALFSVLLFGSIPQFMNFDSDFVRECPGLLVMILFFYILYTSKKRDSNYFIILALLLIPVVIFTHHLTSFLLIILLAIYILVLRTAPYIYHILYRQDEKIKFSGTINIQIIFLILLLSVISYWIYSVTTIVEVFINTIIPKPEIVVTYAEKINLDSPILTTKGYIIYYGFYFFNFIFALVLIMKCFLKRNKHIIEDASFTFFFFFCMFLGFLSLYFVSTLAFPERYLPYGLMFGIIPIVGILLCLKKDVYKKIIAILLVFFFIYNLYTIDPAYLSGDVNSSGYNAGDKEYTIATTIKFPSEYYGYSALIGVISVVQGIEQRTGGKALQDINDLNNVTVPIVINKQTYLFKNLDVTKIKSSASYTKLNKILSLENQSDIDKIFNLGPIFIVQRR